MSKITAFLIAIVSMGILFIASVEAEPIYIKTVTAPEGEIRQFERYEITVILSKTPKQPFDPDVISLEAHITTPEGVPHTIPAFYTGKKKTWKIRYTPRSAGTYSYTLALTTSSGTDSREAVSFEVIPGNGNGFLKRAENNPYYLESDSGKPFYGIGHNICWVVDNTISRYKKYFKDFDANGCNLTRVWINNSWTLQIEREKIGRYNKHDADKLDDLIEMAERYGIHLILVLDSYGSLMVEKGPWNEEAWYLNPYNKVNGGPCEKPWDFFSSEEAQRHYKNRLRYIISRWGYSPSILAFELWNEVDLPPDWAAAMCAFGKSMNPHPTMMTVSLGYPWANNFDESQIWALQDIDLIQRHLYSNQYRNVIGSMISSNREYAKRYEKPLIVAEFGISAEKSDRSMDKSGKGIALHNSLWASTMSGCFAGAMNWWWGEYIRAKNLYYHYRALAEFVKDVEWNASDVGFLDTPSLMLPAPDDREISYRTITLRPVTTWGDTSYHTFTVLNNGEVSGGAVNYYLQGTIKKKMKIDPVFHVDYPVDGTFDIRIDMVSQGATLVVTVDGAEALRKDYAAGPGEGPWTRSLYRKDYKIYQCAYNVTESIPVPKGRHVIQMTNAGKDWIGIKRISLTNYKSDRFANARLAGIRVGGQRLYWIQNLDYNGDGEYPSPGISGATFIVDDIENGSYRIEWWDTIKGEIIREERATATDTTLTLSVPSFQHDLACKIIPIIP